SRLDMNCWDELLGLRPAWQRDRRLTADRSAGRAPRTIGSDCYPIVGCAGTGAGNQAAAARFDQHGLQIALGVPFLDDARGNRRVDRVSVRNGSSQFLA